MTNIHSCSYYCDRPECIKEQRDELRDKLAQPAPTDIRSAWDVFKLIAELPEDMLQHALAPHPVQDQRTEQEPVANHYVDGGHLVYPPPQRTEQNFCSRCGKRTPDATTIHTCTPPQENT